MTRASNARVSYFVAVLYLTIHIVYSDSHSIRNILSVLFIDMAFTGALSCDNIFKIFVMPGRPMVLKITGRTS
jgi:hypothetical protein